MARIQFEPNMKITEMELKSQPSTSLDIKEHHNVSMKEEIDTMDAVVVDYTTFFE